MSILSRRAVYICAIAATALAALAATASGRPSGSCNSSFLRAKMSLINGSRGAGSVGYLLTIRNHGPGVCVVNGHPELKLIGARGEPLPTRVKDQGQRGLKAIGLGETRSAKLRFSPDIPGPGEPTEGPCEPPAHEVKVILSQSITVVAPVEPPTSVCEHGTIQEDELG